MANFLASLELLAEQYFPHDEDLKQFYLSYARDLHSELEGKPGIKSIHYMMADRLAYLYVKSVGAASDITLNPHDERSYLNAFNKLLADFNKELRTLSSEKEYKRAVVERVVGIINDELIDYPDLRDRIAERLRSIK